MYGVAEWFAQKKPKNVTMRLLWRLTNIYEVFAPSMVVTACGETDLDTVVNLHLTPSAGLCGDRYGFVDHLTSSELQRHGICRHHLVGVQTAFVT